MKRLWLIQALGNALLFWCAFPWLGIRDSRTSQLLETAAFGLLILVPWLWLQNGSMSYCGDRTQGLWTAFRKSVRTLALFSAIMIVFVLLEWALGKLDGPLAQAGQRTASWLTFHLRKPVKPASLVMTYQALLWGVRWIGIPVLLLPVAGSAALNGTRKMWRAPGKLFWLQYLLALLLGFYLPSLLIHWVPKLTATSAQVFSFALRFGTAYVLMITSWLAVTHLSAARKLS